MGSIENWNEVLQHPHFWRMYYSHQIAVDEGENPADIVQSIFGPGRPDDTILHNQLFGIDVDPNGTYRNDIENPLWNKLTLPLADGFSWHIHFDSSPGIYHYMSHPELTEKVCLGYDSSDFMLPILRWPEVPQIIASLHDYWRWVEPPIEERFLLPLLAPVAWISHEDNTQDIHQRFREAWEALNILDSQHIEMLVERMLLQTDIHWTQHNLYGWINTGEFSFRNPENTARQVPAATFFRLIQDFLNMLERHTGVASEDGSVEGRAE